MKVAVVGGGVVGLLTALHLRTLGADVLVIERGTVGAGCSWGNMGWVCPSIATPLPEPGLGFRSLLWLLRSNSPLYLSPRAVPRLAPWLLEFHRHCNRASHARGVRTLASLTERTPHLYDQLANVGVAFEEHQEGLLFVFHDQKKLGAMRTSLTDMVRFGVSAPEELDPAALRGMEPALSPDLVGGLWVPSDRHVRPESLTAGVAEWLQGRDGTIRTDAEVQRLVTSGDAVVAVDVDGAHEDVDAVVIAAGAESNPLLSQLGVRIPLQAGKGYSITVDDPPVNVSRPTYLAGAKVGLTPFDRALRIAGTMELSGINQRMDRRRLDNIEQAVGRFIPGALETSSRTDWVGMRPLTPDGVPVIGRVPGWSNAYVSTGHQMLGVTLAPASGESLAHLVLGLDPPVDLDPFDPARLARVIRT